MFLRGRYNGSEFTFKDMSSCTFTEWCERVVAIVVMGNTWQVCCASSFVPFCAAKPHGVISSKISILKNPRVSLDLSKDFTCDTLRTYRTPASSCGTCSTSRCLARAGTWTVLRRSRCFDVFRHLLLYLFCGMLTRQADMGGCFRAGAAQAAHVAMCKQHV